MDCFPQAWKVSFIIRSSRAPQQQTSLLGETAAPRGTGAARGARPSSQTVSTTLGDSSGGGTNTFNYITNTTEADHSPPRPAHTDLPGPSAMRKVMPSRAPKETGREAQQPESQGEHRPCRPAASLSSPGRHTHRPRPARQQPQQPQAESHPRTPRPRGGCGSGQKAPRPSGRRCGWGNAARGAGGGPAPDADAGKKAPEP